MKKIDAVELFLESRINEFGGIHSSYVPAEQALRELRSIYDFVKKVKATDNKE